MRFFLSFVLLLFAASSMQAGGASVLPDSIVNIDKVYEYTFSDYAKAKAILDELRSRNTEPQHLLDIAEGDLYYNTGKYYQAMDEYRRALEQKAVRENDTTYMEQLHRMISCCDYLQQIDKLSTYVELLLDKARACGNKPMESVALFNMGKMLYYQGETDKAYGYMMQAVDMMRASDYKYKYDNLRYEYNVLLVFYEKDRRYEDELVLLDSLEEIVSSSTGGEPLMRNLEEKELKSVYAHRAIALNRLGRGQEAAEYYRKFRSLTSIVSRDNYLVIPYLFDKKKFDEIIGICSSLQEALRNDGDTVSYQMRSTYRFLGRAYMEKGEMRRAALSFQQLVQVTDSIKEREQKSAALELAAVYELHEKNTALLRSSAEARVKNAIIILMAAFFVVLLLFIVRLWKDVREKKEKNIYLTKKMLDISELNERLQTAYEKLSNECQTQFPADERAEEAAGCDAEVDGDGDENKRMFEKIDFLVKEQKLYLHADLSRDALVAKVGINKNRFAEAIRCGTSGRLNDYLNELRINHSITLMKSGGDYSLKMLASESGFANMATFYNAFRKVTGLTPAQFLKTLRNIEQ